ncbi:MAG TPA: thioredoxin domain-containing protein [Verrucomicrobiae bacterium]
MISNPTFQVGANASRRPANRLSREKSPYLLQHQFNPVDWQAWGPTAFAQARSEQRPIFLSIGYSTCHWCHVMERESFEDENVAAFLNEHFVSIKVDREERPDVDQIYMGFVQATTGQGGWPLTVFLTPELKPFFGGTYFPPGNAHGRPGFLPLLQQVRQLWQERRAELLGSAAEVHARLRELSLPPPREPALLTPEILRRAGELLKTSYDVRHGGFGGAPKFPQPSHPQFLLRYARRFHDPEAVQMVLHTCERMAAGGIHDQLGGGFSRYSVDAAWLVPHFEKMLYDNAQLVQLYLDAFLISGERKLAAVARDILDYTLHEMTHPEGGFFSAEDADSEGHEGKFYCWTLAELKSLLSAAEFAVAARYFGITEGGNFTDHSHPEPLAGQNVLSIVDPALGDASLPLLESAKQKMLAARDRRVRPHLDDKVLASWNGLMLGAMARAYAVLGTEKYRAAALRNFVFLKSRLWDETTKTLYHRWREGEHDQVQLLDAYAFLILGVIDLYEATLEPECLEFALALSETLLARFYDAANGGFWQGLEGAEDLILRLKQDYDGAEPSGNSVAVLALLKLGRITARKEFTDAAEATLRFFAPRLHQVPQALTVLLQALDFWLDEPGRAVVAGGAGEASTRALVHAIHSVYQPNKLVLGNSGPVDDFARSLPATGGPVVYLCSGHACQPPTNSVEEIKARLRSDGISYSVRVET